LISSAGRGRGRASGVRGRASGVGRPTQVRPGATGAGSACGVRAGHTPHVDPKVETDTAAMVSVRTPDGRSLDVWLAGPPDGVPVVHHHGTPSHGKPDRRTQVAARRARVRLICPTRPGYAGSTPRPGRSVADVADDVRAVLDHLGITRAVVAGSSGGGPHALATAAGLPGRIVAVATIAGVGPYAADGLDFLAGMGQDNIDEFGAALAGEARLRTYLDDVRPALLEATPEQLVGELGSLLPAADVQVLDGELGEDLAANFRAALRPGIEGWLEDDLAFTRPWGLELASVTVPAFVWQGDQDLMVPAAHGRWLAGALPDARPRLLPGQGHLSVAAGRIEEILTELAEPLR
jgi:pimeloyl-ACP methyl ester carboxylesterase